MVYEQKSSRTAKLSNRAVFFSRIKEDLNLWIKKKTTTLLLIAIILI